MSDGITAYWDAVRDYVYLCEKYGEEPRTSVTRQGVKTLDAYGKHAQWLKRRDMAKPLPSRKNNPNGLHTKYIITKADCTPTDPRAEYFVLRLDTYCEDPCHADACRKAVLTYANEIETHKPKLAYDIRKRWG